jgi:hypothetical protein
VPHRGGCTNKSPAHARSIPARRRSSDAGAAIPWIREARKRGIPTASIHDLGIAPCDSDVSIDGTIAPGPMDLAGSNTRSSIPSFGASATGRRSQTPPVVLIAFGGGHRKQLARALARAIVAQRPDVEVRIAGGFGAIETRPAERGITLVSQRASLAQEYRNASVAVLAGGVSLYEACSWDCRRLAWRS